MSCYVYVLEFDGATKIGFSRYPQDRIMQLSSRMKLKPTEVFVVECENALYIESRVKYLLKHIVIPFRGVKTECFTCSFDFLKNLVEELISCESIPELIDNKINSEGSQLELHIRLHHDSNNSDFARMQGVSQSQVGRWLKRNCVVIDGVVYCEVSKQVKKG